MRIVVFGLAVSSAWGNGHATLWRALGKALGRGGHSLRFFERDVSWYAQARDHLEVPGLELCLYQDWAAVATTAQQALARADAAIVTSYCPDGPAAAALLRDAPAHLVRLFYDLDTPVTFGNLDAGNWPDYLPRNGLGDFDTVLSFTGGEALRRLREELGARRAVPLYGSVDPDLHRPLPPASPRADLSYLGTYAADRQASLERLFLAAARARPSQRFLIGGAQYPQDFPWSANIYFQRHVAPEAHASFFAASRLTLNLTRSAMARMGWCPTGRLFEAAACGVPILSDEWPGLDHFYRPGEEILLARDTEETLAALALDDTTLARIAQRARDRTLVEYSGDRRALELLQAIETARVPVLEN